MVFGLFSGFARVLDARTPAAALTLPAASELKLEEDAGVYG